MRGARWLLLAAIVAIIGSIGVTYQRQRLGVERQAPSKPDPLPDTRQGQATDWHWKQSAPGRTVVEIFAKSFTEEQERFQLQRVRFHIFHKDGGEYDRVESAHATFHPGEDQIFAGGEVLITLGMPATGQPRRQLVSIRTSAVTFDSKTARATTDQPAHFTFENGD